MVLNFTYSYLNMPGELYEENTEDIYRLARFGGYPYRRMWGISAAYTIHRGFHFIRSRN